MCIFFFLIITVLHVLIRAARIGDLYVARVLIDHGASLKRRNKKHLSPIDVAGRGLLLVPAPSGSGNNGSSASSGGSSRGSGGNGSGGGGALGHAPLGWEGRCAVRRALYHADPRSRTLVLSHEDCLGHLPRSASDWECPERIADVIRGIGDPAR